MDSKPFRPRGTENAQPSLHQRHKSTGNLATMASTASAAGMRGPAKRAAFGDVTNTKHNTWGRDGAKVHKAQSVLHLNTSKAKQESLKAHPGASNKENAPWATGAKSGDTQWKLDAKSSKSALKVHREEEVALSKVEKLVPATQQIQHNDKSFSQADQAQQSSSQQDAAALLSRQPRHFKSQPQLKQEQPTLRRTQSRQLERTDTIEEGSEPSEDGVDLVPVPESEQDVVIIDDSTQDIPSMDVQDHYQLVEVKDIDRDVELEHACSVQLPEPVEPRAVSAASRQDTQALSEPEEWWDDEEEEYEDAEQAFTTAHSLQPGDLTTNATTLLKPKVTVQVQRELEAARVEVLRTRHHDDILEEEWDVSMVSEYAEEIFGYLRQQEAKMLPNPHYIDNQTEIQWSMRAVLMEWIVQVHSRFNLLPETLFLTVNYIDRFLSAKVVSIGKLQLVGATAILVASKYEEINCPSLQEIVYMVDNGYSPEEILKAERFMLSMLGFELGWPGPMSFLRRVSKADDYDLDTRTLAKYFLELTIMDERFVAAPPSYLAAGAHCLSRLILNKGPWTKHHVHYSGYTWIQIRSLVYLMLECCDKPLDHHAVVYEKYADKRFKEAAVCVQQALTKGFTLPRQDKPVRTIQTPHFEGPMDYFRGSCLPVEA